MTTKNKPRRSDGLHDIPDLMARCRIDSASGCWTWTKGCNSNGQPSMRIPALGKTGTVGVLFTALIGAPPAGMNWVAHCGNLLCCRPHPKHRWHGTKSQQMTAAVTSRTPEQRARIARGRLVGSVVTAEHVADIRAGILSTSDAADQLGITQSYAWAIKVGRSRAFCKGPRPGSSVFRWRP